MASNRFDNISTARRLAGRLLATSGEEGADMVGSSTGVRLGALAAVAALALAACGSSGGGGGPVASPGAKKDYSGRTLTLWHYEGKDSAMGIAWNKAIKEFEQKTGAKVKFEEKGFEQIEKNANLILNSDSAPDVMEYNKGNATAGLLSKLGLLTNLTSTVQSYG